MPESVPILKILAPFAIADPIWADADDPTKLIQLDASALPTGTTRIWKAPNLAGEIAVVSGPFSRGDILYRGATSWMRLGAGVLGQVLTSQGPNADPIWGVGGGGGTGGNNAVDNRYFITSLTDDNPNSLKNQPTGQLVVGTVIIIVIDDSIEFRQLQSGVAVGGDVTPTDDASKRWRKVGGR